jgi:hypothetical protein
MRGVGHTHTTDERKNKQCQCTKKVMVVDDGPQPRLAAGNKPMRALTERERERSCRAKCILILVGEKGEDGPSCIVSVSVSLSKPI